ncbi:SDR family NAD(P)-dependent oxidoreductase [Pontibacter silvestris]|uniref:SDR family NAD(P)-dependent oxidoreductase n=1 Tax=Pontibacter silvestris TaxID=2305183 RepID=A0ABW4WTU5_9BACT|nr:glucose 1-dehydrogenase [Pontibacter silvestris]MCC9137832.1 glucose 1-dehydrogenase [Pontibacter silvestris]
MKEYYSSKTVLITGGAQGIGRGMAQAFAKAGANVIITDNDKEAGQEATQWFLEQNLKVTFLPCDVADEEQVKELMEQVKEKYGQLDVLINNAGIANPSVGPLQDMDLADFDRVLAVNLRGPLLCTKYALALLEKAEHPAVLNISSTRAFMSEPNTFPYSASKGGLEALTHSLAISLTEPRIRVNAIAPGWIETGRWEKKSKRYVPQHSQQDKEQHPVGRVGTPEDIAEAALFLCSDKAGFITGQSITIDGGMTVKMIYAE